MNLLKKYTRPHLPLLSLLNSMKRSFSSTFVVNDSNAANKIFDATKTRTVALDCRRLWFFWNNLWRFTFGGSENNLGTTPRLPSQNYQSWPSLHWNWCSRKLDWKRQIKWEQLPRRMTIYPPVLNCLKYNLYLLRSIFQQTTYTMHFDKFSSTQK